MLALCVGITYLGSGVWRCLSFNVYRLRILYIWVQWFGVKYNCNPKKLIV